MSNTTITLQKIVSFAQIHVELLPLTGVGGFTNEPALSICNDVLSELIAKPNAWKFNRVEMPFFVTAPFRQDYQFGGATAFNQNGGAGIALKTASTPGVVRTGTTVVVTTLEPHNFNIGDTVYMFGNVDAPFNSVFTQTPSSSAYSGGWVLTGVTQFTFTFTHLTSGNTNSGAPGITNFGWLESATMSLINTASPLPSVWVLEAVNNIQPTSITGLSKKVCVLVDNGDGTLKIRFQYAPGTIMFAVNLVYQGQAPLKSALTGAGTGDWSPFPDRFQFVYRQMFMAHAYRYVNSPKADTEYQKAQIAINNALGADDAEQSDQRIYPEQSLMSMTDGYDEF